LTRFSVKTVASYNSGVDFIKWYVEEEGEEKDCDAKLEDGEEGDDESSLVLVLVSEKLPPTTVRNVKMDDKSPSDMSSSSVLPFA
jgi:hypothetical protein